MSLTSAQGSGALKQWGDADEIQAAMVIEIASMFTISQSRFRPGEVVSTHSKMT